MSDASTTEKQSKGAKAPDMTTQTREQIIETFTKSVTNSNTGRAGSAPRDFLTLRLKQSELALALGQLNQVQGTVRDGDGKSGAMIDTVRIFAGAAAQPEYAKPVKGEDGKRAPSAKTDKVYEGKAGLEYLNSTFGTAQSRNLVLKKDAIIDLVKNTPDRARVADMVTSFRAAQSVSIKRQQAFEGEKTAKKEAGAERGA